MKNLINFEDFWSEENRGVIVPEELISESITVPEIAQEVPKSETKRKRRSRKEGLWFKICRWSKTIPRIDEYRNVAVPEESLPALEAAQEQLELKRGLHFQGSYSDAWSVTIPPEGFIHIWYDGEFMGTQAPYFHLWICDDEPHIIKLKKNFTQSMVGLYEIGRRLTLDDFEIVENPDYRG